MNDLREKSICLLASTSADTQNGDGKTTLYTIPSTLANGSAVSGCIVTHCVVRNPSGSLADGTDFDLGDGADANTWKNTVSLTTMTATTDYMVVEGNNVKYTIFDAGDAFGIKPVTGATADTTATIDVFGYLF